MQIILWHMRNTKAWVSYTFTFNLDCVRFEWGRDRIGMKRRHIVDSSIFHWLTQQKMFSAGLLLTLMLLKEQVGPDMQASSAI